MPIKGLDPRYPTTGRKRPVVFYLLLILAMICIVGVSDPALAQTSTVDAIRQEMIASGAKTIRTKTTLFGRPKIYGYTDTHVRIVVIDPKSGRITRDKTILIPDSGVQDTPDGTGLSLTGSLD